MTRNRLIAWLLLVAIGLMDWIWSAHAGLTFSGWPLFFLYLGVVAAIGIFYGASGRNDRLANVSHQTALWLFFSAVGIIFTYVVVTLRLPLRDTDYARFDAALGFDWLRWFKFVQSHALLSIPLAGAYDLLFPDIILSVGFLALIGRNDRNDEFLWMAMVGLVITCVLSGLFPAEGPYGFYVHAKLKYLRHVMGIRSGTMSAFQLNQMDGIIVWPSFHTVIAIVVTYAHRPPLPSFVPVAIVNVMMLLAIPSEGGHYLADVVAGAVVAGIAILLVSLAYATGLLRVD